MTLTVTIYVLPSSGIGKGELTRHGTDDWTVFQMELVDVERPSSTEETPNAIDLQQDCQILYLIDRGSNFDLRAKFGRRGGLGTWPGDGSKGYKRISRGGTPQPKQH